MPYSRSLALSMSKKAIVDTIVDVICEKEGKASRQAINKSLKEDWGLKADMQTVKDSVTQILTDRVKSGLFAKDKMSYTVTPEGKAFFKKTYKVLINKGGAGEEDDGDSTMVDRGGEEGDETLIDDGDAVMDQAAEGKGLEKVRREGKKGEEDGQEKEEVEKLTLPAKRTAPTVPKSSAASGGHGSAPRAAKKRKA